MMIPQKTRIWSHPLRVIEGAFRAWYQVLSEAFWTNEGVCQVDEQEQGHAATEDVIDKHGAILPLKERRRL
jgi:hypothetical protein